MTIYSITVLNITTTNFHSKSMALNPVPCVLSMQFNKVSHFTAVNGLLSFHVQILHLFYARIRIVTNVARIYRTLGGYNNRL